MAQLPAIVLNSPNFKTYEHWLINGKSFRECERLAKELFSEEISNDSFRKYKAAMDENELVLSVLPHADKDLDIDEEKHLMQQILMQEERLVKAIEFEKKSPVPTSMVDRQMDTLTHMLVQLAGIRGKGTSLVSVRNTVNQQFNKFGTANGQAGSSNSDDELKQWFEGIIREANTKVSEAQKVSEGQSSNGNSQMTNSQP